ncbi:MAG: tryptophan synthase subunit alpha [Chloroflexi bacterium]|nr:tryptophan synthase subunit alpha [Chloroflexota bacterium]
MRRATGTLALLPYVMSGHLAIPTAEIAAALVDAGGDGLEIGVPFSDPMADGPTVQRANQAALVRGMTPRLAISELAAVRQRVDVPLALMGYLNPIVRWGADEYCRAAWDAGGDALIVPDLPLEESGELRDACGRHGLDLIPFVAPTTTPQRLRAIGRRAQGFVYCVAVTGVTGARGDLAPDLQDLLARLRAVTTTPIVVGFGVSRPEHVAWLVGRADGAITASALIDRMESAADPLVAAHDYVAGLRRAADAASQARSKGS